MINFSYTFNRHRAEPHQIDFGSALCEMHPIYIPKTPSLRGTTEPDPRSDDAHCVLGRMCVRLVTQDRERTIYTFCQDKQETDNISPFGDGKLSPDDRFG